MIPSGLSWRIRSGGSFAARRCCDHDSIKRDLLGPAFHSISEARRDVGNAQVVKPLFGQLQQFPATFDRIDAHAESGQDRRLVTRTSTDLENFHALTHVKTLCHEPDNGRLTYGLPTPDGECPVFIGLIAKGLGNKVLPPYAFNRFEDTLIGNPLSAQFPDQSDAA